MARRVAAFLRRYPQILTASGFVLVWEVVSVTLEPRWLPTVQSVASAWWDLASSGAFTILDTTAVTLVIGLTITLAVAAILTAALGASPFLEAASTPFINAALATPTIALIPIFEYLWGFGDVTRVATVVSFALFPTTVTWVAGVRNRPSDLLEMARSFDASRGRQILSVVLPAAAPMILVGFRIAVIQGIKGVISAEIIIGVIGIGRLLEEATLTFDLASLYAVILTVVAISFVSYLVFDAIEHRASRWAHGEIL